MAFLDLEGLRRFKNKLDEKFSTPIEAIRSWKPSSNGRSGQILRSNGDGTTSWQDAASSQDVANAVDSWMDDHISPNTAVALDASLTSTTAAAQGAATGNMVLVTDAQPSASTNKVWIKKTPDDEVLIPTLDEHNDLKHSLERAYDDLYGDILPVEKLASLSRYTDKTSGGVSYSRDVTTGIVTASGIRTTTSAANIISTQYEMPSGIIPGKQYDLDFESSSEALGVTVFCYVDGHVDYWRYVHNNDPKRITIPETTTGIAIRIEAFSGEWPSDTPQTATITFPKLYTIPGVDGLVNRVDVLESAMDDKQDQLSFDSIPTASSTNPVTSDGIYVALSTKANKDDISGLDHQINGDPVFDVLAPLSQYTDKTSGGVSYSRDVTTGIVTASGIRTTTSAANIISTQYEMPSGIIPGKQYDLDFESSSEALGVTVFCYVNGSIDYYRYVHNSDDKRITIPANTTGIAVRLEAFGGKWSSTTQETATITFPKMYNVKEDVGIVGDIEEINRKIGIFQPEALQSDIGKALIVKAVHDGNVTEYEYGSAEPDFSSLEIVNPLINLYEAQEIENILDGYILKRGVPQTQYGGGYIVVDYIPVTGGDTITFNITPWGNADDIYRGAEYTSEKEYIGTITSTEHTLSSNAAYIRFSVKKSDFGGNAVTVLNTLNSSLVISNGARAEYAGIDEERNMFLSNDVVPEGRTYFVDASTNEVLILSKMYGVNDKDVGIKLKNFTSNTSLQFSSFGTIYNNSPFVSNKPSDYVEFMNTGEDFFGPIVGFADNNGDGDNPSTGKFTGGMHKYGGYNTARLISQDVYFDGVAKPGFIGYCNTVDIIARYNVQASNTVKSDGTGREVVEQITKLHFENGVIYTETLFKALEPMYIQTFYFMQGNHRPDKMGAGGVRYIGSEVNRSANDMEEASNSGDMLARTMRMLSDTIQMDITIDDVDIGRFAHSDALEYSAFTNVYSGYSKCYFNAIRSSVNPIHLNAGDICVAKGSVRLGIFE